MSCPDWRRLDPAARDADPRPGVARVPALPTSATAPAAPTQITGWEAALRHLDTGCPRCWQEATALDPTLIFRRLPALELDPAQEADEVATARQAVTAMRTARRVGHVRDRRLPAASDLRHLLRGWSSARAAQRTALAAGLTTMALVFGSGHGWHAPTLRATPTTTATAANPEAQEITGAALSTPPVGELREAASALPGSRLREATAGVAPVPPRWPLGSAADTLPASSRSSIEGLSRPRARVYQLDGPHMSVVMIVDDKLDV
jgi:hypothetical protein